MPTSIKKMGETVIIFSKVEGSYKDLKKKKSMSERCLPEEENFEVPKI